MGPGFESLKVHHGQCPFPIARNKCRANERSITRVDMQIGNGGFSEEAERQRKKEILRNTMSAEARGKSQTKADTGNKLVLITHRVHPFPFRTRKLSYAVPKILDGKLSGKIGRR